MQPSTAETTPTPAYEMGIFLPNSLNQWSEQNHMTPVYTWRALWLDSMPWFLKQAKPRLSGKLPVFQSDVAPLSMTHCNNKETEKRTKWWLIIPAWPCDSWPHYASSCRIDHGHLEGFLSHRWRWQHCLSSTRHSMENNNKV